MHLKVKESFRNEELI